MEQIGLMKFGSNNMSQGSYVDCVSSITRLPVFFMTEKIKKRFELSNVDFRKIISDNVNYDSASHDTFYQNDSRFEDLKNTLIKTIGAKNTMLLGTINVALFSESESNMSIDVEGLFTGFSVDIRNSTIENFNSISKNLELYKTYDCAYNIEVNDNNIIIIMNDSFFIEYSKSYKDMSKELCDILFKYLDERKVYQTPFFKRLVA